MSAIPTRPALRVITIPTDDAAFLEMANLLLQSDDAATPQAFEARLRRMFPRAVVRARELSGEAPAWYVYRDGGWRASLGGFWWEAPGLPRIVVGRDGWLTEANATALGLLEIGPDDLGSRHFTDFVAPGTLDDSLALFEIVDRGNDLTATVLLRPASGHLLAVDLHGWRDGDSIVGVLRLAEDVEPSVRQVAVERPSTHFEPVTDAAFRGYAEMALGRMPEPSPEGLALRLRRLYPHAEVVETGDHWLVRREPERERETDGDWWRAPGLPTVRYDAQALIVEANEAAVQLLGRPLVGHHWQEFVTPGSTEQVSAMLAILAEVGGAESRFRMPRADGALIEFDSYTEVDGETYTTIMRRRE
jgi:PAS domain-containing protein